MVVLDWDEYFSMQGNVATPGYQRIALRGFITERRSDGLYAASLLPALFYGADGTPLTSWRQNITGTGQQTILSRSGGLPKVPKEDLYWRKVSDFKEEVEEKAYERVEPRALPTFVKPLALIGAGLALIYILTKD